MATPEEIEGWKSQYGEIKAIEVTIAEGDVATAYLKPADRNVVAYGLTRSMKSQIVEAGEFVLKNCYIGGDERLKITGPTAANKAQLTAAIAAGYPAGYVRCGSKKRLAAVPVVSDKAEDDDLQKMAAIISHYLHLPFPEQLSDEEFATKFQQADWLRRNPQVRGTY